VIFDFLRGNNLGSTWPAQLVARAVYPYASVRTVVRGPLKGLRFKVAPAMGFTYAWGIGVEQWAFPGLVRPGMCVYDIGANCGQSTLSLAAKVGTSGRVIAFEPVDRNFSTLVCNIGLNPSLQVIPVNAAAAEQRGWLDFHFDVHLPTQGHLRDVEPSYSLPNAKTVRVRAVRLDDYATENWPAPQFMKIDVEGGAGAVLNGAQELIARHRPTIYVELHGPEEQQAVRELLEVCRYRAETLSGQNVPDPTAGSSSPLVCRPQSH
jgi:FkbM family methyltransferase